MVSILYLSLDSSVNDVKIASSPRSPCESIISRKRSGPRREPFGTPLLSQDMLDLSLFATIYLYLLVRNSSIDVPIFPQIHCSLRQ